MDILKDLKAKMITAMKAKEREKLTTIRGLISSIKNHALETGVAAEDLKQAEIEKILTKAKKQRIDSITQYKEGGRDDLVATEQAELDVINGYLPELMDEASTTEAVQKIIEDLGIDNMQQIGQLMGKLQAEYAGKMDMGVANGVIKGILGK